MTKFVESRRIVHGGAALLTAVLLAGLTACVQTSDAVVIDDVVFAAAARPELFLSTPKRVEGALKQLYRRGFLAGV